MEKTKGILDRVKLPTRVIVHRSAMSAATLAAVVQKGELAPGDGRACELEAGGQVLARGRIVRRRGEWYFKVTETAEAEERS
jgi:hypothetical protein